FGAEGAPDGPGLQYDNTVAGPLQLPRAVRWDLGVDRSFLAGWHLHVRYQERYGRDELVVNPSTPVVLGETIADAAPTAAALVLSSDGRSPARSLETTVGYRGGAGELYVSYVRASARGDLNTFDEIDGLFRNLLVQANHVGPLPASLPNRALIWGLLHLPRQV